MKNKLNTTMLHNNELPKPNLTHVIGKRVIMGFSLNLSTVNSQFGEKSKWLSKRF